jgi:hypothetical protein
MLGSHKWTTSMYNREPITLTIMQLGPLNRVEVENSIGLANQLQRAFRFESLPSHLPLDKKRYKLPNSGYDLDLATVQLIRRYDIPRPVIFLTSAPYSTRGEGKLSDWFYFSEFNHPLIQDVSIISTYIWEKILGRQRLQPYLLSIFASFIFSHYANLEFHNDKHGCLLDYCFDFEDIDAMFNSEGLCDGCERELDKKLRQGDFTLEQKTAAIKLFNRACDRKVCFMVMPFRQTLKPVYQAVGQALREKGWIVRRADEVARPRRITDAILQEILTSDLIVADLTGSNPNVFYELGLAHATGCDVILLTQDQKIPFDVSTESTIFYKPHKKGLLTLVEKLHQMTGNASSQPPH